MVRRGQVGRVARRLLRRQAARWLLLGAALTAGAGAAQTSRSSDGAPSAALFRLAPVDAEAVIAAIHFLPSDLDAALAAADPDADAGAQRLVVTGAYTRADKFEPGGLVIRQGEATTRFPQAWDGVLLVSQSGKLSLHNKRAVRWAGRDYDLETDAERVAFLDQAEAARLSALQSHLLISEGALDLRKIAGAPRFVRRLLFDTFDGRIGVYESDRPLTLYEAAAELQQIATPRMALNLDMGAYNFCETQRAGDAERCGVVSRAGLDRLTNLISLQAAP